MIKKIWLFISIIFLLFVCSAITANAIEPSDITDKIESKEFDEQIQTTDPDYSLKDIVINSISGKDAFSYKDILSNIADKAKDIFMDNIHIFITLIIISIMSGFVKAMLVNLEGTAAKMCSYSILTIYVSLLLKVFYDCYASVFAYIDMLSGALYKFFPVFASVTALSGKLFTATVSSQVLFWTTAAFAYLIKNFFLPVIIGYVIFSIVNALSKDYSFTELTSFMSSVIKWSLGGVMTIFVGIVSLQSVIAPAHDTLIVNASSYTVKTAVPVLGSILSDTVGFMASSGGIIKSAVGVAGLIGLVLICFVPILTILIKKLILTTSTAILEPVIDPSLAGVVKSFGNGLLLLMLCQASIAIMSFINISLMIRSF